MKATMKRMTSIRTMVALALLIVSGFALAATREPASIQGQVDLGTFQGTVTVNIGGDTFSGTVQVIPEGGMFPRPDGGADFPLVKHEFSFESGTLTTYGAEFSVPMDENPDIHTLHGNMEIVSGTGVFEGASGELRVNGQMDWSVGLATFQAKGVISR